MSITTDAFLERVKRRVTFPANGSTLNDTNLLIMADDAMREHIIPLMLSVNKEYFVVKATQAITSGTDTYDIPYRSIGRTFRELKLQNGSSTSVSNLAQYALEDEHLLGTSGIPSGFYFQGDKVVLAPCPLGTSLSLLEWYDLAPSDFVLLQDCAKVVSVSGADVTCETVPSNITSSSEIDFVQGKSGNSVISLDVDVSSVADPVISFAASTDVPTGLVAGDYICESGKTPVLQIPNELVPLLEIWTGQRILYAMSDYEGAQLLVSGAPNAEKNARSLLAPRISGESTKIVNRNGLLKGKGNGSRYRVRGGYYP